MSMRVPWAAWPRPVRALVYLLLVLALVLIYREAEFLIARIFSVVLLFVFAAIVAMLLTPVVDWIEARTPFLGRRAAAVLGLNVVFLLLTAGFVIALAPTIAQQVSSSADQAPRVLHQAQDSLNAVTASLLGRGIDVTGAVPKASKAVTGGVVGSAVGIFAGTARLLVDLLLVTVIAIYFQIQGRELIAAMRKLFPERESFFDFTLVAAGSTLVGYIRGQLLMALIISTYTGVALTVIGVHYAVVIAVAAFFLEFLPLIGAPVAMLVGVMVALLQSPVLAGEAAAVGLLGHALEAYVVGPRITGHATRVHPLAAMAALLIGAELGGVLGALFAVPLAGMLNVYLGALYRARRGEEAFALPDKGETPLESLPRLGDEISSTTKPDEVMVKEPVPKSVRKRKRAERPAAAPSSTNH